MGESPRRGFTLIELLVVIALVAVIASMVFTGASRSISSAQTLTCLGNMRQVGIAARLYSLDKQGRLPDIGHLRDANGNSLSWSVSLKEYLGSDFLGKCPANRNSRAQVSYAWNDLLTTPQGQGLPMDLVPRPSQTLALAEHADGYLSEHFHFRGGRGGAPTFNQFKQQVGVTRHGRASNYLFVDGHVETLPAAHIQKRLAPGSPFLQP